MRKVQLTIKQEEVAPATTSDLVVMNNGKTLKEELSTNVLDKFSREVTVVSSMEKVADGVKDGAYESLVIKGKSLVNLMTSCKDETLIQYHNPPADSNVANVSMIKPNTVYTIIYSVKYREEGNTGHLLVRTQQDGGDINVSSGFTFGTTYKRFAYKFTTPSTIDYFVLRSNGHYFHVKEVMLLEGDYTNVDLPYFEGLCDSKMPILRNVGKNLFDKQRHSNPNNFVVNPSYWSIPIQLKGNTLYNFSYTYGNVYNKQAVLRFATDIWRNPTHSSPPYNLVEVFNTHITSSHMGKRGNARFTTPANGLVYLHYYNGELGNSISSFNIMSWYTHLLKDVQLEEASSATSYEDHKTNILHTPETVTLRSLPNGVRDELNLMTGEYIKRIGEVVLDGTQNWTLKTGNWEFENTFGFVTTISDMINTTESHPAHSNGNSLVCSHFPSYGGNSLSNNALPNDIEMIGIDLNRLLGLRITKTKLSTPNAEGLKTWLRDNPVTVQYELAEPVTTIVEPLTIPFAYENGHVILESGFEGQSLLPELKYSAPASKSGVLSTTSKTILKHEQRLHKFEDLLLRESILMDYRLMLTMLDSM